MTDSAQSQKKLQWKWIGIAFFVYLILYLGPWFLMVVVFTGPASMIAGWSFGGIVILAAATSYWSKSLALWEPCVATLMLLAVIFFILRPMLVPKEFHIHHISVVSTVTDDILFAIVVLLLSLVGSWLGTRIWKARHPAAS